MEATENSKYLVVIEKTFENSHIAWDCVEVYADDIGSVVSIVSNNSQFYDDCVSWEVLSINKEWKIGGSMVDSVGIRVGRVMPQQ